jgi:hypothetical protein
MPGRARGIALMHWWLPPKPDLDAAAFVERTPPSLCRPTQNHLLVTEEKSMIEVRR